MCAKLFCLLTGLYTIQLTHKFITIIIYYEAFYCKIQ